MSETRMLLQKITALRQRLDQAQGLANEARTAAAALLVGGEHDLALDAAVRPLTGSSDGAMPRQLTARARRILERGRDLLGHLRKLADTFAPPEAGDRGERSSGVPLIHLYRDTVAMIDTALRTVALLPESAATQMHLCRGLEVTLEEVASRLRTLTAGDARLHQQEEQIACLVELLVALDAGQAADAGLFDALADQLLAEARECEPLRFLEADPHDVPRFIACHSLTVARVLARVIRHDSELRARAHEAVVAALVHDVGMLAVPGEILAHPDILDSEQRRMIEGHSVAGARLVGGLFPNAPMLAEAVASHHERLDGTGYPDGLKGNTIRPLARLLAVCDVYAAFCTTRPHRQARPTRTALADTLLLVEQGQLDHHSAECLLSLSFYPVGSVVELAHGAIGVVVATPGPGADLNSPARPVVALLTDSQGEPLPRPHHIDLAQTDSHSIVRLLEPAERIELLGRHFPRWAA
jgi:HD-GYP domain-containing protein (c-di-GMP phosphodiesterase class II)